MWRCPRVPYTKIRSFHPRSFWVLSFFNIYFLSFNSVGPLHILPPATYRVRSYSTSAIALQGHGRHPCPIVSAVPGPRLSQRTSFDMVSSSHKHTHTHTLFLSLPVEIYGFPSPFLCGGVISLDSSLLNHSLVGMACLPLSPALLGVKSIGRGADITPMDQFSCRCPGGSVRRTQVDGVGQLVRHNLSVGQGATTDPSC